MTIRMQQRRATSTQWTDANTVLASGEIGLETDTGKIKIGDGSSTWSQLQYTSLLSEYRYSSSWEADTDPVPSGKLCFDEDTAFFKLGDGVSAWSNLEYFKPASYILGDVGINFDTLGELEDLLLSGTPNQVFVTPDPDGTPIWSNTLNNLGFDTVTPGASGVGVMAWNDTDGTLEFGLKGGNVTLQLGQEQVLRVRNNTASTLTEGTVVYIKDSNGINFNVEKALADDDSTSAQTLGVLTENISASGHGYVTTNGLVRGIDISYISGLASGDLLFLSPTTAGQMTKVKPSGPNHLVYVGYCLSANGGGSNSTIFVKPQNGYELNEIHDVSVSGLANNDILTYDTSGAKPVWVNKNSVSVSGDITSSAGIVTAPKVRATSTGNSYSTDAAIITGSPTSNHLGIGVSGIVSMTNDVDYGTLNLQHVGGNINMGHTSGTITIAAGTATAGTAPLKFTSGTNLSVPEAGAIEYDGNAIYTTTNASHGRGALASILFASGVNASPANSNAAQNWFPAANDALTVSSGTTYLIEAILNIATTGTTSNSLGISILGGGNATIASCTYAAITTNGTAATTNASSTTYVNSAANTTVTAAVAAATNRTIVIKGILRVTTSGTIIPTFTYSAAPGAVPTLGANNFICLTPIGNATVASIGAWA